jgi:glucosyl-3-phosphoglycerate synthase
MSATAHPPAVPAPHPSLRAVVVVPARDEAERISGCLRALTHQQQLNPSHYEVIVVLDGCHDDTALRVAQMANTSEQASRAPIHAVELTTAVGVGRARRLGMELACERLLALDRPGGLIASTDADSLVAEDWLESQLALTGRGAHAIGGHIELHPEEAARLPTAVLAERKRRAAERMQIVLAATTDTATSSEHHQFSGASLSLTAETYRRCGGLPARAALEDEALEQALSQLGIPIHRSRAVRVHTSARVDGRAPRGLAHDLARTDWRARRSYRANQFTLARLLEEKQQTIALVLPAREVAETIGPIAEHAARLREVGLLDEIVVIDAASPDGSAAIAAAAGVTVLQEDDLSPELGPALGKGDAMWRALRALDSEIVAYADTDTEQFSESFLTGLLGPLICDPAVQLVKGCFRRPFRSGETLSEHGGGRVTELLARPVLNLHAPELAVFDQPLAGELAGRRALLEQIPFSTGYGVEIAMLIDAWRLVGLDGLAQVDLGVRHNRHQSLRALSAMAYAVLVAAESRFLGAEFTANHACGSIALPPLEGESSMETRRVSIEERPPLAQLQSLTPQPSLTPQQ